MDTPICDFVNHYAAHDPLRLHMPGHKGVSLLGMEALDITEISGADSLYEAAGIIRQSEANAEALFGCRTFYSTEGSSQCIRAMLQLAALWAKEQGNRPIIFAARNVHKTFLSAAALLDIDVQWLFPHQSNSYLSCVLDAQTLDSQLQNTQELPVAVYITSPDYLGNRADIRNIADVCKKHNILLLVDNAHGAYQRFLPISAHPMDLGADICCASAHKTLPALTGSAYLHISSNAPQFFADHARDALSLFGSTSPSYLILQSLDAVNRYIADGYPENLAIFAERIKETKKCLDTQGYRLCGDEVLKITIATKHYGYTGQEFADILLQNNVVVEFADPDFVVLMLTPQIGEQGLRRIEKILKSVIKKPAILHLPPAFFKPQRALSVREAMLSPSEYVPVQDSAGRVLASASVGCPPAVPIVMCGEIIDQHAIECFQYYGIERCCVVKSRQTL